MLDFISSQRQAVIQLLGPHLQFLCVQINIHLLGFFLALRYEQY